MTFIQKCALGYAIGFFFIAIMGYIPTFVDEQGNLFGLFSLDLHDNLLHAFSGLWALVAGLVSHKEAVRYFKIFGSVYFLDGMTGLLFGNAFLDLSIIKYGIADLPFMEKFALNIPHIIIGGVAALAGFCMGEKKTGSAEPNGSAPVA